MRSGDVTMFNKWLNLNDTEQYLATYFKIYNSCKDCIYLEGINLENISHRIARDVMDKMLKEFNRET